MLMANKRSIKRTGLARYTVVGFSTALGAASVGIAAESGPDAFRTQSVLLHDVPEFEDPTGYSCAIPGGTLTLNAAIDLALCRNPATRSAWASAHQQAAVLGSAESAWLPQVGITGQAYRQFGEHVDVEGQAVSGDQNTGDAAATLTWTLYDFGARTGRIRGARRLLDAAALNVSSVSQQTVLNVVQAYYGVVAADAAQAAANTTETVTSHSLEIAQTLRTGGAGTLADVLQAETAYEQAVLTRVQADAAAATARGTLAVTLGVMADQSFLLQADPVPAEVPPFNSRISDLMAEAVRQRPDLAAAQAQRDAAEANIQVARSTGMPVITVNAGHDFIATNGIPDQHYSQIGIGVTIPIFTGFNVTYGVRQAQAALESSDANLDQVRLGVSQGVWNSYYALHSANDQLTTTRSLSKTAEDNEEVALGRYQAGVGTIVDVLTAQTGAATARQVRINAELSWRVARAQLALALGRLTSAQPVADGASPP
jgi:outer membrane protein